MTEFKRVFFEQFSEHNPYIFRCSLQIVPKSKKNIRKSIESLQRLIIEHREKIRRALETRKNLEDIPHWQQEIKAFQETINRLIKKLKG